MISAKELTIGLMISGSGVVQGLVEIGRCDVGGLPESGAKVILMCTNVILYLL